MSDTIPDGGAFDDAATRAAESMNTVTNDAVAGETVLPGSGDGNDGPTGGSPAEGEPIYDEDQVEVTGLDDEADETAGRE